MKFMQRAKGAADGETVARVWSRHTERLLVSVLYLKIGPRISRCTEKASIPWYYLRSQFLTQCIRLEVVRRFQASECHVIQGFPIR